MLCSSFCIVCASQTFFFTFSCTPFVFCCHTSSICIYMVFTRFFEWSTLIYFDKIARICTHYISNPVSPDGASQNNPWLLLYKLLYKHVVCRQKAKKWKTIPGTYVFPTETRGDYFWIFLWPAVGGNTFSPLLTALILGPVRYNSCR